MGEHDGILLDRWESTGDQQAFMELVTRYQGMVFGVCVRIVKDRAKAEELVQECFLKLTKTRPKNVRLLGPWLHRVATNAAINQLGSETRRQAREKKYMETTASTHESSWDDVNEILDEELNSLPIENREVIIAHFLEGHTQVDVAQKFGVSRHVVADRMKKGLDSLHRKLRSRGVAIPAAALSTMMTSEIVYAAPSTLTAAMGKAVLRGAFSTKPMTKSAAFKYAVSAVVAGFFLLGLTKFASNGSPNQPDLSTDSLQQVAALGNESAESPPSVSAVAAEAEDRSGEGDESAASIEDDVHEEVVRLQCIDGQLNPVPGVQVYVLQYSPSGPPLVWGYDNARDSFSSHGPLLSDDDGYIEFAAFEGPEPLPTHRILYAVLPNQMVGAWSSSINTKYPWREAKTTVLMVPSKSVSGKILFPVDYDPTLLHVDTSSISVPDPDSRLDISFRGSSFEEKAVFPGLFDVVVDSMGNFEIHNVPAEGSYNVRARGPGLGERHLPVWKHKSSDRIEMSISEEGVLEGTVRYADTGNPVVGRNVYCMNRMEMSGTRVGKTDLYGRYSIRGLSEGIYDITVELDSYPPTSVSAAKSRVNVEVGLVTEGIDFELETGKVISGTTTNDIGAPLENVLIVALSPATPNVSGVRINSSFSDANGKYDLRLPTGDTMLYVGSVPKGIEYPNDQAKRVVTVTPTMENHEPVDFAFKIDTNTPEEIGTGIVVGRAIDSSGNPIPDVLISWRHETVSFGQTVNLSKGVIGKTDENGKFSVKIDATGNHKLTVGGKEWSAITGAQFTIAKDETKEMDDVTLEKYTLKLVVQTVDEEGSPVPHVTIYPYADNYFYPGHSTQTDIDGMLYLDNLPDTEIRLNTMREGYVDNNWTGFAGEDADIVLEKGSRWTNSTN
jgi:RNA polymerase sigma factor (sigma-70 family)